MSGYWEVLIGLETAGSDESCVEPDRLDTAFVMNNQLSGSDDDTAQPFGEEENVRDIVAAALFDTPFCEGVITEEEGFKEFKRVSRSNKVRAFFSEKPSEQLLENNIRSCLSGNYNLSFDFVFLEDKDWSKEWKKNWKPTKISEKIVIRPTWCEYESKSDEIVVNLDPGMAFGTGAHETTRLCVRAMEKYLAVNDELADIGCGSGILAICGIKLGAKSAAAIDNDESVIPVAIDNATLNNVEDKIKFFCATSDDLIGKTYDFICANILHNVLDEIMGDLKKLLKPGGKMVLSGILDEKEYIVTSALAREGLNIIERLTDGHWVGLVVGYERG